MRVAKTDFKDVVSRVDETLKRLEDRNVTWRGTRFEEYRRLWLQASTGPLPRVVRREEYDAERPFFEAANQCQQLVRSAQIWDQLDPKILRRKLQVVMRGEVMPAVDLDDDLPRNTLLELHTAAFLGQCGLKVQITAGHEDVTAEAPGLEPVAVECKRPCLERSFENNLKKIRDQLYERCSTAPRVGLGVVGIDRVVGLLRQISYAANRADLQRRVVVVTKHYLNKLCGILTEGQIGVGDSMPLVAVLLTGTVFVGDEGMPYTVEQLAVCTTSRRDKAQRAEVALAPLLTM